MKIVVLEVVGTTERTSKAGKPYKLTTLKDVEGNLYTDLYIGRAVKQGDELELTRNDRGGWDVAKETSSFSGNRGGGSKDSPEQRASIEWQSSYKTACEVTRDYYTFFPEQVAKLSLEQYAEKVDWVAAHFKKVIDDKPTPAPVAPQFPTNPDLPPVENYDDSDIADKMAGAFYESLPKRSKRG